MEPLSFGEAIDREEARLAGQEELLQRGTVATSAAHEHFSYVARGRYAEQLERWYARFPRQNVLVMRSEDLYTDPQWAYRPGGSSSSGSRPRRARRRRRSCTATPTGP